jgi:DNA-binding IclR family transcriptional regulator
MDIKKVAAPFLQELLEQCNETVNLAVLDRGEVVYIDQLESTNIVIVKMFARVGNRGPAYCTGSGKVLLAGLTREEFNRYLSQTNLQRFTTDTITDPIMLSKEIERVRKDGYALDLGERDEGVRCIAAPIKNQEDRVIAALSVSGPSMRVTASFINNELVPLVIGLARRISEQLGWREAQ